MAVAKYKNFTIAGQELNVAQSAVSRQIRLLEESLGQQLLVRSPQYVFLTPAGQALYTHSQGFENWSNSYFQQGHQEIRIGVMSGVVDSWLIPRLSLLKEESLPNLSIVIQNERKIRDQLDKGELDMGILVQPIESESITSRVLFKEDYFLISKKEVDLKKLHQERWIFGTSGSFLKKASKKVSSRFIRVNSIESIIQLVKRGMGIAIIPSQILKDKKGLKVYTMKSMGEGKIYLALPNYKIMPKVIQEIVDHISV
ncbi:MAG: LysR family transcriptional regulator [Bdellovibrionales bacterium]|nr:LysR family transcriptional regulator [Bdellovibrionales bacterium]NQZ17999.1 LysR family transcriptional regulator [Bdellovibrionales bacterium]